MSVLYLRKPRPAFECGASPLMVAFEAADGRCEALCYRHLRGIDFEPGDVVRANFTTGQAVIRGRNLKPVWQALHDHQAVTVREGTPVESEFRSEGEPHIDSITVQ